MIHALHGNVGLPDDLSGLPTSLQRPFHAWHLWQWMKDHAQSTSLQSFAAALKLSKYFRINLDIGHFTSANYDAVAYLRENHANITNLHVKDRKRNQGENVEWGTGDAPIREVLQLLKQNKWPITAYLEYEYKGAGTPVEEVKKGLEYMRAALG